MNEGVELRTGDSKFYFCLALFVVIILAFLLIGDPPSSIDLTFCQRTMEYLVKQYHKASTLAELYKSVFYWLLAVGVYLSLKEMCISFLNYLGEVGGGERGSNLKILHGLPLASRQNNDE